jgi:septum formation protein
MPHRRSPPLILASSSPFRQALLRRLDIEFTTDPPDIDEAPHVDETPEDLATRLAEEKARAVAIRHPGALLIGSDQVALLGARILGKPGNFAAAVAQLLEASGRTLRFLTSVCLFNAATGRLQVDLVPTTVRLREIDRKLAESYIERERPYGCAGAFMIEGLGIALMEAVESEDPTALIGLPLIALTRMLRNEGIEVLRHRLSKQTEL